MPGFLGGIIVEIVGTGVRIAVDRNDIQVAVIGLTDNTHVMLLEGTLQPLEYARGFIAFVHEMIGWAIVFVLYRVKLARFLIDEERRWIDPFVTKHLVFSF